MATKSQIIVIGGGIAGLVTAIRLRRYGYRVAVYEKNDFFGGRQLAVQAEGFTWDIGQDILFGIRDVESLFKFHKQKLETNLSFKRLEYDATYFLSDMNRIRDYHSSKQLATELQTVVGQSTEPVINFLNQATYFQEQARGIGDVATQRRLSGLVRMHGLSTSHIYGSAHRLHQQYFHEPSVVEFFDAKVRSQYGSNPFTAPGLISLMSQHQPQPFWIKGGAHGLAAALLKLASDTGVTFFPSTPVQRITQSDGVVTGIITDNGWVPCEAIVSAVDIRHLYGELITPSSAVVKRYLTSDRDSARLTICLGVNTTHRLLDYKNIFVSQDMRTEEQELWRQSIVPRNPTIYLSITSKLDTSLAPKGCENWLITVQVPSRTAGSQKWVSSLRTHIVDQLSRALDEDLESHILYEKVLPPSFFEDTFNMYEGAWRGAAFNSVRTALFRHPYASPGYKGLYSVGMSSRGGSSLGEVLVSAKNIATLIREM